MKYQKIDQKYLVVLKKGEEIMEQIKAFLQDQNIANAQIQAIGAVSLVELAHYSVEDQKYSAFKLEEPLEMTSLLGNCFLSEANELIIHLHGSFSRPNGETLSGHFIQAIISGTAEIFITPLSTKLIKHFDPVTGLKLLDL